jgi:DNA-binding response OmpR family regulator
MAKILFVEDDRDLTLTVSQWLESEHHTVEVVHNGQEGLDRVLHCNYDVIILDWSLPEVTGVEICRQYRNSKGTTPVMMLTGKDMLQDKEAGLDSGADDYLTKPFSLRELLARIRALLRRPTTYRSTVLKVGNLVLDTAQHQISKNGQPLQLLPIDFALLEFLMRHPNEVFSADALIQRVWHTDSEATSDALRTALKRIRKKIDDDPDKSIIENIPRVGYLLRAEQ